MEGAIRAGKTTLCLWRELSGPLRYVGVTGADPWVVIPRHAAQREVVTGRGVSLAVWTESLTGLATTLGAGVLVGTADRAEWEAWWAKHGTRLI